MNKVILLGRLTKDPQLRRTNSGKAVTSFTVAVNRQKKDDPADFIDCVAWENTAEFVSKYFGKGQMIAVSGRLQIRDYTDKDNQKHRVYEVVVDNVYFGGDKAEKKTAAENFEELEDNERLPF